MRKKQQHKTTTKVIYMGMDKHKHHPKKGMEQKNMVEKTIYESAGKVVLEFGTTGIMIITEEYSIYERAGLSDGKIFDSLRWG